MARLTITLKASDPLFSLNDVRELLERIVEQMEPDAGARPCPMCSGTGSLGAEPITTEE